MDANGLSLAVAVVNTVAPTIRTALSNHDFLLGSGELIANKGEGHMQLKIDQVAEDLLFEALDSLSFRGTVFSEERGRVVLGNSDELFVTDPYCNTSLTFRGLRESAITGFHLGPDNELLSGAIADMQMPRTLCYQAGSEPYVRWDTGVREPVILSRVAALDDATIVVSAMKAKRRHYLDRASVRRAAQLLTVDGGIVPLRLCLGEIDAFADFEVGQPSYEALPYLLVRLSGGIVTDGDGRQVQFGTILEGLRKGEVVRQSIIAAGTDSLLRGILSADGTPPR